MHAARWILGIILIVLAAIFVYGGISSAIKETDKKKRNALWGVAIFFVIVGFFAWFVIVPHRSKTAAVGTNARNTKMAAKIETSELTPDNIVNYNKGVKLQVKNIFNEANNNIAMFESELTSGDITANEFRNRMGKVDSYVEQSYGLFKKQATPKPLKSITEEYNELIDSKLIPLLMLYQSTSKGNLSDLNSQLQNINRQKAAIDKQYGEIKSKVMTDASKKN